MTDRTDSPSQKPKMFTVEQLAACLCVINGMSIIDSIDGSPNWWIFRETAEKMLSAVSEIGAQTNAAAQELPAVSSASRQALPIERKGSEVPTPDEPAERATAQTTEPVRDSAKQPASAAPSGDKPSEPCAWMEFDTQGFPIGVSIDKPDGFWRFEPLYRLPQSAIAPRVCPYCTSDNQAIRSTYYDQTCEGCVKRMSGATDSGSNNG